MSVKYCLIFSCFNYLFKTSVTFTFDHQSKLIFAPNLKKIPFQGFLKYYNHMSGTGISATLHLDSFLCCKTERLRRIKNKVKLSLTCLTPDISNCWGNECLRPAGGGFSTTSQLFIPFSMNSSSSSPTDSRRLLPPEKENRFILITLK